MYNKQINQSNKKNAMQMIPSLQYRKYQGLKATKFRVACASEYHAFLPGMDSLHSQKSFFFQETAFVSTIINVWQISYSATQECRNPSQ